MPGKPRGAWAALFGVYYCCIAASLNLLKVPPVIDLLTRDFGVGSAMAGFIVSAASIAGLILVFPSAIIMNKIGAFRCGVISIGCIIIGGVVGALSRSLPIMLTGRVIEGCGTGITGVIATSIISRRFRGQRLGLPMAILSTWFPVGCALGFIVSSNVGYGFGTWRASWWAGVILEAAALAVFALTARETGFETAGETGAAESGAIKPAKRPGFLAGVKNARIWCLGVCFAALMIGSVGFLSFATRYFAKVFGMDAAAAGSLSSLGYWFTALGGVAAGVVSRMRKGGGLRPQFVQTIVCAALAAVIYPLGFLLPRGAMLAYLFALGAINGYVCAIIYSTVPRLASSPKLAGAGMSVIFFFTNLSSLCASPLIGAITEGGAWKRAAPPTLIIMTAGLLFAVLAMIIGGGVSGRAEEKASQ